MKLKNLLSRELVKIPMQKAGKEEILSELLDLLVTSGRVADSSVAYDDLLVRERRMTTAIQNGVAIPHARTKGAEMLSACVGIHPAGVDFGSLDGEPTRIFVMLLVPGDQTDTHLEILREIGGIIRSERMRDRLVHASDASEILSVFGL
jgi:PTS system nitrogen regulatory IIA component